MCSVPLAGEGPRPSVVPLLQIVGVFFYVYRGLAIDHAHSSTAPRRSALAVGRGR